MTDLSAARAFGFHLGATFIQDAEDFLLPDTGDQNIFCFFNVSDLDGIVRKIYSHLYTSSIVLHRSPSISDKQSYGKRTKKQRQICSREHSCLCFICHIPQSRVPTTHFEAPGFFYDGQDIAENMIESNREQITEISACYPDRSASGMRHYRFSS